METLSRNLPRGSEVNHENSKSEPSLVQPRFEPPVNKPRASPLLARYVGRMEGNRSAKLVTRYKPCRKEVWDVQGKDGATWRNKIYIVCVYRDACRLPSTSEKH
jgi:hypothetical protein